MTNMTQRRNFTQKHIYIKTLNSVSRNLTHPTRIRKYNSLSSCIFQIIVFIVRHKRSLKNKEHCWCENKMQTGETLGLIFKRRNDLRQSLFLPQRNSLDVQWGHETSAVLISCNTYTKRNMPRIDITFKFYGFSDIGR